MVTWTTFKILPLGGRPNAKPGDHNGTLKSRDGCFIYFIMSEDPT